MKLGRRLAGLDGHVLGVEPEGVVAHGMQHALPLVAAEAGDDVAHGVVLDVAHVGAARRIREHLEDVGGVGAFVDCRRRLARGGLLRRRWFRRPAGGAADRPFDGIRHYEGLGLIPDLLPLRLDLFRIVLTRHRARRPFCRR